MPSFFQTHQQFHPTIHPLLTLAALSSQFRLPCIWNRSPCNCCSSSDLTSNILRSLSYSVLFAKGWNLNWTKRSTNKSSNANFLINSYTWIAMHHFAFSFQWQMFNCSDWKLTNQSLCSRAFSFGLPCPVDAPVAKRPLARVLSRTLLNPLLLSLDGNGLNFGQAILNLGKAE